MKEICFELAKDLIVIRYHWDCTWEKGLWIYLDDVDKAIKILEEIADLSKRMIEYLKREKEARK